MKKKIFFTIVLVQILILSSCSTNALSLEIYRSKSHEDQTEKYTPLVVTISSSDINEKIKDVDFICVVDVSGSMSVEKLNLVKESLKYLLGIMDERDKFALVTFSSSSSLIYDLNQMTKNNKNEIIKKINYLRAEGGTNIYSGLETGLSLLKENYISGEKIASIILLSDGEDNYYYDLVVDKFKELLISNRKNDYAFTLHTFGYGVGHDAVLMNNISKIKDGGYFAIEKLSDVKEAFLKIYGYL